MKLLLLLLIFNFTTISSSYAESATASAHLEVIERISITKIEDVKESSDNTAEKIQVKPNKMIMIQTNGLTRTISSGDSGFILKKNSKESEIFF